MSDAPSPDNLEPPAPPPPPAEPSENAAMPGPRKQRTMAERILHAGVVVMCAHIIVKVLALILQVYLTQKYGVGVNLDAYTLVYSTILTTLFLTGEEALGPAFLPTFMALKDGAKVDSTASARMGTGVSSDPDADPRARELEAWGLARSVALIHGILLIVVVAICMINPGWVVDLWLSSTEKGSAAEASQAILRSHSIELLRLAAGGLIGWSLGSLTYLMLNSYKVFFWAALGDSMLKVGVLLSVALLSKTLGYQALGIGVLVGGMLKLALHLWGLRKIVGRTAAQWNPAAPAFPKISFTSAGFKEFCWLLMPVSVGIVLGKVRDRYYAAPLTSSKFDGVLAAKSLGRGMFDTLGQLIPYALSIAMYPFFCDMVDRGDRNALGSYLTKATRMVIVMFILLAVGMYFLAEPACAMLFYRAPDEAKRVGWIALSFWINAIALPAAAVEMFQMQAYFSNRKLVHAQVIGIVFSTLAITLTILLTSGRSADWIWGLGGLSATDPVALISGVSIAFVLQKTLKVFVLGWVLRRHLPVYPAREMGIFFLRLTVMVLMAAAGIWAVVRGVGLMIPQFGMALHMADLARPDAKPLLFSRLHLGAGLAISALLCAVVIYAAAWLAGLEEINEVLQFARLRVQGFRNRKKT